MMKPLWTNTRLWLAVLTLALALASNIVLSKDSKAADETTASASASASASPSASTSASASASASASPSASASASDAETAPASAPAEEENAEGSDGFQQATDRGPCQQKSSTDVEESANDCAGGTVGNPTEGNLDGGVADEVVVIGDVPEEPAEDPPPSEGGPSVEIPVGGGIQTENGEGENSQGDCPDGEMMIEGQGCTPVTDVVAEADCPDGEMIVERYEGQGCTPVTEVVGHIPDSDLFPWLLGILPWLEGSDEENPGDDNSSTEDGTSPTDAGTPTSEDPQGGCPEGQIMVEGPQGCTPETEVVGHIPSENPQDGCLDQNVLDEYGFCYPECPMCDLLATYFCPYGDYGDCPNGWECVDNICSPKPPTSTSVPAGKPEGADEAQKEAEACAESTGVAGEGEFIGNGIIDMTGAPAGSATTALGYPRNSRYFWEQLLEQHPEFFSPENEAYIKDGKAPQVDDQWLEYHPGQEFFKGDILVHHHIEQGPYASGVPESFHIVFGELLHWCR